MPYMLGVVAFLIVVGPRALNPENIAWLGQGDQVQHFLGWHFFRNSDWTLPPGLNPDFGIELSSAIVYSDSNPLLALLFKPFSNILPEVFQYFGLWLLVCFVLQAWFAWKLLGLITNNQIVRILGAGFFVFSPPMIFRMAVHLNLAGHFLVLAALYLALKPKIEGRALPWAILLSVSALVHAYLLAMVGLIWLADLAGRLFIGKRPVGEAVREVIGMLAILALVCWMAGYFSVGQGVVGGGFGQYRMNLLSIFDAGGWSFALKDIPKAEDNLEGFNFLGLGTIILALWSIPILISGRVNIWPAVRRQAMLLLVLLGLTLFALSNSVGIADTVFHYSLPEWVLRGANIFRASGRMFWPVFYMLVFVLLFVVIRGHDARPAITILAGALILQVVDTSAAWAGIRTSLMAEPASEWSSPLKDPFWADAARKYKKIRWIQPANVSPNWQVLATFAAKHHMATDAVYLARVSHSALTDAQARAQDAVQASHYEADTLYILNEAALRAAALSLNEEADLLARIDGFSFLAPGWKKCQHCMRIQGEVDFADLLPPVRIGDRLEFRPGSRGLSYLASGWSSPEAWGIWSDGEDATVLLPAAENLRMIVLEANAWVTPAHPEQRVRVSLNGIFAKDISLKSNTANRIEIPIADEMHGLLSASEPLNLQFEFSDAARPVDLGAGNDGRALALGLVSITLQ